MRLLRVCIVVLALMTFAAPRASAQLHLAPLFEDGMVIQRDAEVPVWGTAEAGATVTVTVEGANFSAAADGAGRWTVTLPARPAGGPLVMEVAAGGERVQVEDILVGDVWVASGQSNMEWVVADVQNAEAEIAAADDPAIRHFKVPRTWAEEPQQRLPGGSWEVADPEHVGSFTAVGYFFARALRPHVDVPIGLINTSWGGSRIEPWMSAETLDLDPAELEAVMAEERARDQQVLTQLREHLGPLPEEDRGLVDGEARWAAPGLDESAWSRIPVPGLWEEAGYPGMDGVAWYRTSFELTEEEASRPATLGLGMIDDSDIAWVNGQRVGSMEQAYSEVRTYEVPASALQPGRNVVAVRVEDTGGGGGIYGAPDLLFVETSTGRQPLAGDWHFRVGEVTVNTDGRKNQLPTLLYNAMVHPLLRYPVRGVIWYQGESNANTPEDAAAYRELFAGMIGQWRADWDKADLPFLWVQLANYMQAADQPPAVSNWATLRESQHAALELPYTGEAVIIDIGEADDIHPRNKQDVGRRLALAARHVAYGEDGLVYSGPVYVGHEVRDSRVVVSFDHVGGGLDVHGDDLGGFAIAGPDREWVWAEARIEGDEVVVWSDAVDEPIAVRYAWSDNPDEANLYNEEGLPAAPFRTDDW